MKNEARNEIQTSNDQDDSETFLGGAICWKHVAGKGRGVFARLPIAKGAVIERAPVVPVAKKNIPDDGPPDGYVLDWDLESPGEEHALVMGYIMLLNHSDNANVHLESDLGEMTVTMTALRDIAPGEEITWDYNCELWFDPA